MKLFIIVPLLVVAAICGYAQERNLAQPMSGRPIALNVSAIILTGSAMGFEQLLAITKSSVRENIARSLSKVTGNLVKNEVAGTADELRTGRTLHFAALVNEKEPVVEQRSINVCITYEARPIGGIMNIRVELVPIFGGIGSASRPVISREFVEAVDNFDEDAISQTIARFTHELAAEYTAKQ